MLKILPMAMRHYEAVLELWRRCAGVHVGESDSREGIRRYLRRNRGLSLVAVKGNKVAGAILAGHDGRRGLLHHLAVDDSCRGLGIGRALVEAAQRKLKACGIKRGWIAVLANNAAGRKFWKSVGWREGEDVVFAFKDF